ncbi:hypothetical protein POTOM_037489 [Populus tomentosa]|uniref:Peptidase C1A papain C-terminal domain-containing protein n=1 Tax=Populus tomentosa TaxID=118781 RepID=A0A8X7YTY0_POPTO|nr:hypothetical protein POTOM_037489 [Populus tomentosa]
MDTGKVILQVVFSVVLVFRLALSFDYSEEDLASEERLWDVYERDGGDKPYKLKLNRFADMTNHEFLQHYGGSKVSHYRMLHGQRQGTGFIHEGISNLPSSVDWRKNGAVTGIWDQGKCAKDESCDSTKMNAPVVNIDGYEMVPENDGNALMKAVVNQPVAIAMDAGGKDLRFYSEASF